MKANGQEFLMFAADPQLGQKLGTLRCTIKLQRIPLFLFICCRHSGTSFGLSIVPRALLRFVFVGIGGWGGVDFSCKKIHNLGWWYSCWTIGYQVFLLKLQESSHTLVIQVDWCALIQLNCWEFWYCRGSFLDPLAWKLLSVLFGLRSKFKVSGIWIFLFSSCPYIPKLPNPFMSPWISPIFFLTLSNATGAPPRLASIKIGLQDFVTKFS